MTHIVSANDLHLFAVNTGPFYQQHLAMARSHDPIVAWDQHFDLNVVPLYRKQIKGPLRFPSRSICDAAEATKAYYERHITEF
ncbi:hypothetical protein [Bradyrhizobium elkanii]|uniref:Uncharacterized protein n=1 Tax=Bradyrhizobium elkanii TaxID=29448 RepID=A0ABV4F035_BRAEL|nr:hypothetical protein [Bradyrhizobium elkanii]MCP1757797.1 hypothetical protein [Bradyrhizobium elkanii]MCS3881906.1 hypothetical protein [Bradyrhizobium elkanii]MCS4218666.1 hypothetical protein [Bradyrhizobium elkanii]MCW2201593.1 hypothetical protein [Bradyrhizobium elkanii]MCW2226760.1 hypothetical protein [Bradyrhizobium elkanii]